jgi:hypothetical protein
MADAVDHPVIELRRVRQGPVKLGDLASGKSRNLSKKEVTELEEASKPGATPAEAPEAPVAPRTQAHSQARSHTHSAAPASRTRQEPAAPGGRVAPFKAPGTGTGAGRGGQYRRNGERRFEEDSFNRGDNRRSAASGPGRGPRSGPARFERDETTSSTRRTPGNPRFERDENSAPATRRPYGRDRFEREENSASPYRGQRSGPPRFDREETSAPPRRSFDRPRRESENDFERGQGQGRDRDRDRGSSFDRGAPPRRNFRQDADSGGEGARPFRSGPSRPSTGSGPSRDRNNDSPAGNRNSGPGGRRFPPANKPEGGSGPTGNRRFRPNPSGFVPAAERSAPTPGRGRADRPPARSNQSASDAPNRGSRGPARGRPAGPRNYGGGRQGRDE